MHEQAIQEKSERLQRWLTSNKVEHRLDDLAGFTDAVAPRAVLGRPAAPFETEGILREGVDDAAQERFDFGESGFSQCNDVVCRFRCIDLTGWTRGSKQSGLQASTDSEAFRHEESREILVRVQVVLREFVLPVRRFLRRRRGPPCGR